MRRQLIIQLARIGDLIQSKRLALSLKNEGEVHIVLDKSLEALGRLIFPYAILHPILAHASVAQNHAHVSPGAVLSGNAHGFAYLAELDFSSVYNLNRSPLSLSITSMFDAEQVIGYRLEQGQATSSTWSKMAWRWTLDRKSSPLNLVDFWAFFHPEPITPTAVNPVACQKNIPGKGSGQRLGFVLSGRVARRSLPPEYLAAYITTLFTTHKGPAILLLGDKNEQETARRVCKYLKPALLQHLEDMSGKTSLTDLYEIISGLDLLFTPDTGAMHLAAHLGTPVMAAFLSSAWVWETGPYGLGHEILQAACPCAPCLETAPCPHKTVCLTAFADQSNLDANQKNQVLLKLSSELDALGATYRVISGEPAPDIEAERSQKRRLLGEYLNTGSSFSGKISEKVINSMLAEQDWMLPDYF
ncbi:MAG: glycosyltransferase family 9 protein [Deltaproteobacteria bacterium]|jgi:ADP-heptose:LPS heptosyltransferase|nr:glycosyltransferase family 9 protein [Deltaproteobacteria bacterium]